MNKAAIGLLIFALLMALFFPLQISSEFSLLGIPHQIGLSRESFFFLLAAALGVSRNFRLAPIVAILFGCFLMGPLATCLVAALIVYDRSQKVLSWWSFLKDFLSLFILVLSSGLPEPVRSALMFFGIMGISLDFGIGTLGLMPAVLFAHTARNLVVSDEVLFVLVGAFSLFHLFWIWLNGAEAGARIWRNGVTLLILSAAILIDDQRIIPVLIISTIFEEMLFYTDLSNEKVRLAAGLLVAAILSGLPIFIGETIPTLLAQKELLWAIPILPMMVSYFSFYILKREEPQERLFQLPIWAGVVVVLFSLNGFWWSSTFSPQVEFGGWGLSTSIMAQLFDHPAERSGFGDQNVFLISQGLVLLGIGLGALLYRYFKAENKMERLEKSLFEKLHSWSGRATKLNNILPEKHHWMTDQYNEAKTGIFDLSQAALVVMVSFLIVGICFKLLKNGGLG